MFLNEEIDFIDRIDRDGFASHLKSYVINFLVIDLIEKINKYGNINGFPKNSSSYSLYNVHGNWKRTQTNYIKILCLSKKAN